MEVESAPKTNYQNSNHDDSSSSATAIRRRRRRRTVICLSIVAVLLALAIVFLILGLTVFKAKRPVIAVRSVSLGNVNLSLDIARLRVSFNLTVDVSLLLTNPNRVGFEYTNSSSLLQYGDQVVGEVPVPAGQIGARQTRPMNVSLTLMADRLLSNSNLYSQLLSGAGTLHFSTSTRISGHVRILFRIHVVSYSTCDFYVDVFNRNLANQTCHYKTRL